MQKNNEGLKKLTGKDIMVHGSGRTDSVCMQKVANFILENGIPTERILALNGKLPGISLL